MREETLFHSNPPQWRQADGYALRRAPRGLRPWLHDESSLTALLTAASGGDFRVRVITQTWDRLSRSEAQPLGVRTGEPAYVRHVQLVCKGQPWVFARTVIPKRHLTGPLQVLTRLGNRSLGAYLFSRPRVVRGAIQVARLRRGHALHSTALAGRHDRHELWGRRSVFRVAGHPLLVNEIFLPDFVTTDSAHD